MQAKQFNIEVELLNEGVVMKKTLILLAAVIPLFLFGCASTQVVPADIQYKEIKGDDYLDSYMDKLIEQSKAYKIVDVYISKIDLSGNIKLSASFIRGLIAMKSVFESKGLSLIVNISYFCWIIEVIISSQLLNEGENIFRRFILL